MSSHCSRGMRPPGRTSPVNYRWRDWYEQVRAAAIDLSDEFGPIAVGGLSMGGALTLALGEDPELRGRIAALVAVNPGMTLTPVAGIAELLAPVVPTVAGIGSDVALDGVTEEAYDRTLRAPSASCAGCSAAPAEVWATSRPRCCWPRRARTTRSRRRTAISMSRPG